ncbi:Arylesterase [compost metagenome]|uniref:alpha/beta fold hydrolase n=1 Tax=Achromobacter sp. Root83 TaxID=1736602 RepID=UPI00070D07B9|nr:alpha/beta hydrolase [Achromobacter sp. Root83]KRC70776.1 alpha/beta hydrolase [Achromobacter sp. Root83]
MCSHHWIVSGRASLFSEAVGEGDPVVFLHAGICDRRMWRAQLDGVAAYARAIAYDRRGFGQTRYDPEDHSAVADLMAVIDTMAGGKPAILVGCSQGGRIAIDAALRHPERVRALVLISPTVPGAPEAVYPPDLVGPQAELAQAEAAGDLKRVNALKARLFLDGALGSEGRVTGGLRELFLDMNGVALESMPAGANLDAGSTYDRLGEIAAPALILWGSLDYPHIQARCRQVAALMPEATGVEVAGAAHLPSLERPADIAGLLAGFINGCTGHRELAD